MSPVTEVRDITLPVAVLLPCWSAPLSPRSHSVKAQRSRDISESGTFVHAAACPPLGASVGLRISLEAAAGATETLPIEFDGHVLRVERVNAGSESGGFAVVKKTS